MEIYQSVFLESNLPENTCRRVSSTFIFLHFSYSNQSYPSINLALFISYSEFSVPSIGLAPFYGSVFLYTMPEAYTKEPQQHKFMLVAVQYQRKNFIPVKLNLPTVSCKCRTTTHFGIKSATLWSGLDSWLFSSIQYGIAILDHGLGENF